MSEVLQEKGAWIMHRRTFLKRIGITAVAVGTVGQWTLRAEEEVQEPNEQESISLSF